MYLYVRVCYFQTHEKPEYSASKHSGVNSEAHLRLFVTQESKGPKAVIFIKTLNAMFQPEKIDHPHGLQITFQNHGPTRSLFVYHESAEVGFALKKTKKTPKFPCRCSSDCNTFMMDVGVTKRLIVFPGNSFMVQRHPRCSLRIPEDCVSCRERWGSRCLCVYVLILLLNAKCIEMRLPLQWPFIFITVKLAFFLF